MKLVSYIGIGRNISQISLFVTIYIVKISTVSGGPLVSVGEIHRGDSSGDPSGGRRRNCRGSVGRSVRGSVRGSVGESVVGQIL